MREIGLVLPHAYTSQTKLVPDFAAKQLVGAVAFVAVLSIIPVTLVSDVTLRQTSTLLPVMLFVLWTSFCKLKGHSKQNLKQVVSCCCYDMGH